MSNKTAIEAKIKEAAMALEEISVFVKAYQKALTALAQAVDAHDVDGIQSMQDPIMLAWKKLDDTSGGWSKLPRMTQFSDQMLSNLDFEKRQSQRGAVVDNAKKRSKR